MAEETNTSGTDTTSTDAAATTQAANARPGGDAPSVIPPGPKARVAKGRADSPAAGTSPAAAATEKAKRFSILFDGKEVERSDSPIVAHARVQEGFEVFDEGEDYAKKIGVEARPKAV